MIYFKRKDGSIFGKKAPSEQQLKDFKKNGYKECNEDGSPIKKASKKAKKK